jgi:hypothetical protein
VTDRIALAAAAAGDLALAFPGRRLLIRPADAATAWLGLPAPPDGDVPPALPAPGDGAARREQWQPPRRAPRAAPQSFACLEEALGAASDGDAIVLLPGTHNVRAAGGLALNKRVCITGGDAAGAPLGAAPLPDAPPLPPADTTTGTGAAAGAGADGGGPALTAVIDYRGNSPLFRITRSAPWPTRPQLEFKPAWISAPWPPFPLLLARRLRFATHMSLPPTPTQTHPVRRSCVIQCLEVDMVGFAPCVLATGPASSAPLLRRVRLACSGGDCVAAGGAARPLLEGCTLTVHGRRRGARRCSGAGVPL